MNSGLANISVNLKLALGFGVVLLFTALLSLLGWSSLDRSGRVGARSRRRIPRRPSLTLPSAPR